MFSTFLLDNYTFIKDSTPSFVKTNTPVNELLQD